MKKQNLDFEVTRLFFVNELFYNSDLFEKCRHVGFCDFRYRYCSQGIIYDYEITQHMHCVILLLFEKSFRD